MEEDDASSVPVLRIQKCCEDALLRWGDTILDGLRACS